MLKVILENEDGQQLDLSSKGYDVIGVSGLTPPSATVEQSKFVGGQGMRYKSSRTGDRNIVLNIRLSGDVANRRRVLYNYISSGAFVRMYFDDKTISRYIDGHVDNTDCDLFSKSETMQISVICSDPYFKSTVNDDITVTLTTKTNTSTYNIGGVKHGISFRTVGSCDKLKLTLNNASITLDSVVDNTEVDTRYGLRKITPQNVSISDDSDWIFSKRGNNTVSIETTGSVSSGFKVYFTAYNRYEGF